MGLQGTIHIHPETAAVNLQADFDGDRLAFERADKYPALSAEIKEALLPQNRYPDVVKRDKVPLSNELQVAVDGPKSALRPDRRILSACSEIGGYLLGWQGEINIETPKFIVPSL